jgi:hypothetical protein
MRQVFNFFGKCIRQSCEPTHRHSQRQILSLNKTSRNSALVGIAQHVLLYNTFADRRAVPRLRYRRLRQVTENLVNGRIIDAVFAEHFGNYRNVGAVAVSRELEAPADLRPQKAEKFVGSASASVANVPTGHKFGIRAHRNPSPRIAKSLPFHFSRAIPFFGVRERPNFVALDLLASKIAKNAVLIFRTGATKIAEKFNDSVFGYAGHSHGSADAVALDQARNNLRSLLGAQFVHASSMLERSSIVNRLFFRQ